MDHQHNHHVFPPILRALTKASKNLQINPVFSILFNRTHSKPAIEAILNLGAEAETLVSSKPFLFKLSQSLHDLEAESQRLEKLRGYNFLAIFYRRIARLRISRIARSIGSEIESLEDRTTIEKLLSALTRDSASDDGEKIEALAVFRARLSRGFDGEFQELVLKGRVFHALELVLIGDQRRRSDLNLINIYDSVSSQERIRDEAAVTVLALVEFNKDVFVGAVLMGPTTWALVSTGTYPMLRVLCSLVDKVKAVMVDHIESTGEISRIVSLCGSEDVRIGLAAVDVAMEVALFGSREAVEDMVVVEGLVKRLMELQRVVEKKEKYSESLARGNLVARLAVEVSAGEGLERREKRELRSKILSLIRECSVSKFEYASIVCEILWDSFFTS